MIRALDHVNIRVRNLKSTLRFYEEALGMFSAPPPGMGEDAGEAWIHDASGRPVLHVGTPSLEVNTGVESHDPHGNGAIHHVAFDCADYELMLERLRVFGVAARCNDIPAIRLRQIFVRDPNEVLIELNFR